LPNRLESSPSVDRLESQEANARDTLKKALDVQKNVQHTVEVFGTSEEHLDTAVGLAQMTRCKANVITIEETSSPCSRTKLGREGASGRSDTDRADPSSPSVDHLKSQVTYPGCFKNGTPSEPSGDQPKFPSFDERDGHKTNRLESSLSVDRLESQGANATDRADPSSPSVDHPKSQVAYTGCFEEVLSLGNDPDDATKEFCNKLARVPLAEVSDKAIAFKVGTEKLTQSSMVRLVDPRIASQKTEAKQSWLCDMVMRALRDVLIEKDSLCCTTTEGRAHTYFADTYFYQRLLNEKDDDEKVKGKYAYENVEKTLRRRIPGEPANRSLLTVRRSYFPIFRNGNHWICCAILNDLKQIILYNPLGIDTRDNICMKNILQLLVDEHSTTSNGKLSIQEIKEFEQQWKMTDVSNSYPRQENG
jgi:hypothetical protein